MRINDKMIDVTCAIIRNEDDDILIVQRGAGTDHPYKWEFPGGKTNEGETHEECIIREIAEELSMSIVIRMQLEPVEYDYGFRHIRLIPFLCDTLDELPVLSEHVDYRWIGADRIYETDFSEADRLVAEKHLSGSIRKNADIRVQEADNGDEFDEDELKDIINRMMSQKEADWMAVSATDNPKIFSKLLEYSYSSNRKLAFRASWTLSKACDKHPEMIFPHLGAIVQSLKKIDNESVERSFLRILSFTDLQNLGKPEHGILADHCFAAMNSPVSAIAVKAYAMEILYRLTIIYPDLGNELAASVRLVMEEGSAGMIARGNMILKKIREMPLNR